ncbi:MAG: nucleotidyltransferase family protein, partial [Lachnospiraceae bacterium]|nr:nucleotidyltransferase family protein [Candidatus Minthocola equi]
DVLHDRTPDKIPAEKWPALYKELCVQAVYSLPGESIAALGLSGNDAGVYLSAVIRNRQIFHKLMKEQKWALTLLEAENIPAVVLKGAAAAINYTYPENRCMGDIDLLVLPQDFDRAYHLLTHSGCRPLDSSGYARHIGMFTESGVEIELHRYFSSSDNKEQNAVLDEMLFHAIPNRVSCELCGYPVSMLPPLENGLVLLGHINQHLSAGLGLRQIIDWMVYAEKYLDDELWNNGFSEAAEKIGMKRLAVIITAMCRKYLGFEKDIHWDVYEPVCDELMAYILAGGNSGRKESYLKRRTVSVLKQFRNPFRGFATAQRSGLINWKATQKYPILRPFAWCYQLGRWTKQGLKAGITPGKLSDARSSAKEKAGLMEKLGVTRL